jgi:hypothetical protein
VIFDTDIIIFSQRGNIEARKLIVHTQDQRHISTVTYIKLLQGAQNKSQHRVLKSFIKDFNFHILPITEAISTRATTYIEEYSMAHGLELGDALIAATAIENSLQLVTANVKHFRCIRELDLKPFKPRNRK